MNTIIKREPQLSGPFLFRNRIINGAAQVNQRANTGINSTTGYFVDRFYAAAQGGTLGFSQASGNVGQGFQYTMQLSGAAGVTSSILGQKIESTNIYDLAGSTVTFATYLSSTYLNSVNWVASYPNVADNYTAQTTFASGTFNIGTGLNQYTTQIALPSGCQNGLNIAITTTGFTAGFLNTVGWQLEAGSIATPFERLPISLVNQLCQRYYCQFGGAANSFEVAGYCSNTLFLTNNMPFPSVMRASPTYNLVGSWNATSLSTSPTIVSSPFGFSFVAVGTLGSASNTVIANNAGSYLTFNAEL